MRINTEGTDPSDSGYLKEPGWCHFMVESFEAVPNAEEPDHITVNSVCRAAANALNVGKKQGERFTLVSAEKTDGNGNVVQPRKHNAIGVKNFLQLCEATGLCTRSDRERWAQKGESPDINIQSIAGRQFCALVTVTAAGPGAKNPNAKFAHLGFDIFNVHDAEKTKDCPKDMAVLKYQPPMEGAGNAAVAGQGGPVNHPANGTSGGKSAAPGPAADIYADPATAGF